MTASEIVSWHDAPREDAQVATIALYKRERAKHHPGCLIAVNANYTCYVIRGGTALSPMHARSSCIAPLS